MGHRDSRRALHHRSKELQKPPLVSVQFVDGGARLAVPYCVEAPENLAAVVVFFHGVCGLLGGDFENLHQPSRRFVHIWKHLRG
jgi:hypothetical protein